MYVCHISTPKTARFPPGHPQNSSTSTRHPQNSNIFTRPPPKQQDFHLNTPKTSTHPPSHPPNMKTDTWSSCLGLPEVTHTHVLRLFIRNRVKRLRWCLRW